MARRPQSRAIHAEHIARAEGNFNGAPRTRMLDCAV
jgi:hypothetical protein